jgi:hypothetical protein
MSISVPPGQPSITQTLASSFRDAFPLAKKNAVVVAIALVLAVIAATAVLVSGWRPAGTAFPVVLEAWIAPVYFMLLVVSYYALAAGVRTINPEYRMTVGQFFGFLGYSLLVGLLTAIAGVFLIVPAYWIGVKIMLAPYAYIVENGAPGTLKRTWDMTTGYYWQTVGMMLLSGFCVAVICYAAFFICGIATYAAPVGLLVFGPLAIAIVIWLVHVQALVYVRWTNGLLPRANTPQAVPVPA